MKKIIIILIAVAAMVLIAHRFQWFSSTPYKPLVVSDSILAIDTTTSLKNINKDSIALKSDSVKVDTTKKVVKK